MASNYIYYIYILKNEQKHPSPHTLLYFSCNPNHCRPTCLRLQSASQDREEQKAQVHSTSSYHKKTIRVFDPRCNHIRAIERADRNSCIVRGHYPALTVPLPTSVIYLEYILYMSLSSSPNAYYFCLPLSSLPSDVDVRRAWRPAKEPNPQRQGERTHQSTSSCAPPRRGRERSKRLSLPMTLLMPW